MNHTFVLYGLTVHSAIDIPEAHRWEPSERPVDLVIRCASDLPAGELEGLDPLPVVSRLPEGIIEILFRDIGRYHIDSDTVTVWPVPGISQSILRLPLLGMVASAVLVKQGRPVLHGSAVEIGGEAVAFIGDKRFGKSTMAGALVNRGHRLVADDVVVLDALATERFYIRSGPFGVKLWPDAVESLGIGDQAHYPLYEGAIKRVFQTRGRHVEESVPLRRIYVLSYGDHVEIAPITPSDGLIELMRNAFMYRYPESVEKSSVQLLKKYAPIRRTVDMKILHRPADKDRLTEVAEVIEADLRTSAAPAV